MQLRAFASGFERAKSRLVAFSRVWSRLVAPIFFSCSDTFGHVWACSFVISRHFSSFFVPKWFFSGMAGKGRLRHCLGREGSSLLRVAPAPGGGWENWHGIHVRNRYTVAAGPRLRSFMFSTIVLQNRGGCSCWESQGASQNGGGFLSCFEGQDSRQLSELWFRRSV